MNKDKTTEQTLATRLRALRQERGLSQEALAEALEVSRQAVTKWEDGSSLPSTAKLFALAGFFGVSLAELTDTPERNVMPTAVETDSDRRTRRARGIAWLLLALCLALLAALVLSCIAAPSVPQGGTIIGYADGATELYVTGAFPTAPALVAVTLAGGAVIYLLRTRRG